MPSKTIPRLALPGAVRAATALGLLVLSIEALSWKFALPGSLEVLGGIVTLWEEGKLQHDVAVSMVRWLGGWSIGAALGVSLGLLTGRSKSAGFALEGFLTVLRAIPFISLVPLSIRIFGLSERGKIFLVAWASAGVCWVVVHRAAATIPSHLAWRARTLGADTPRWVLRLLLPACSHGIHSGLRASLSLGLIVVAVAEMSGVYERASGYWFSEGLGYRLFRSLDESRDDLLLASICLFALLGIAMDQAFLQTWIWTSRLKIHLRRRDVEDLVERGRAHGRAAAESDESARSDGGATVGLRVEEITAAYNGTPVLDRLSLVVPAGATMSVVGPSGCGKTTLIRAIARLTDRELSVTGATRIGDELLVRPGPEIGVVLHDAPVFEHLTVWANVTFGSRFDDAGNDALNAEAWHLIEDFGLADHVTQLAGALSGGQRQRLSLATALANRPRVLLLDEPFGALDAITRRNMQKFYWRHVHGHVTAIFVTHDLEEALIIANQVRIGVRVDATLVDAEKNGHPPDEWELQPEFGVLRTRVIEELERV